MSDQILKEYKYKFYNADDFLKLFFAGDADFEQIKQQLVNNGNDGANGIKREGTRFKVDNVEFEQDIVINKELKDKCSFFEFKNVKLQRLIINLYQEIHSNEIDLVFTDCDIDDLIIRNSPIRNISCYKSKTGDLKLEGNTSAKIIRLNSSIVGSLYITDTKVDQFIISGGVIENFIFKNNNTGTISLNDSSSGYFSFSKSIIQSITLINCSTGDVRIEESNIQYFKAEKLYCSFRVVASKMLLFQLNNCHIPIFFIALSCNLEAYISGGWINKVDFRQTTINKDTLISFFNVRIYSMLMEEFAMLGNLFFRKIKKNINPFVWYSFEDVKHQDPFQQRIIEQRKINYDELKSEYEKIKTSLKGEISEATIRVSQSSLGKTEFIDCPLAEFRFEFNNSKITDCFVSGDSIPTQNVHILSAGSGSIEEHQQKASFFNQFKKIFEAQGDIYHATQFQAKWADQQRKLLELIHQKEKGWFNTTFSDLWILKLNKWSNLHGESWPRAFFWIMSLGLVFYLTYLWTIDRLFTFSKFDFNLIGYYFEFLNPTHRINFIGEVNIISGWTIAIDVIWRMVVAYLIYQFIAAFRKHTKKQ